MVGYRLTRHLRADTRRTLADALPEGQRSRPRRGRATRGERPRPGRRGAGDFREQPPAGWSATSPKASPCAGLDGDGVTRLLDWSEERLWADLHRDGAFDASCVRSTSTTPTGRLGRGSSAAGGPLGRRDSRSTGVAAAQLTRGLLATEIEAIVAAAGAVDVPR